MTSSFINKAENKKMMSLQWSQHNQSELCQNLCANVTFTLVLFAVGYCGKKQKKKPIIILPAADTSLNELSLKKYIKN